MALIEGFRVRNYRALRDITLGRLSAEQQGDPLTPFTVVIGKNGVGKSTLFDAFGFVADCLSKDVESACDDKQRGGFERMRSLGTEESIRFDIYYREAKGERPITYELAINLDSSGRPFVESEVLKQRRKGQKHGRPYPFLRLHHGVGKVWAGEEAVETSSGEEDHAQEDVELTDLRQLGIATLGTLKEHPRIKRFRDFLKGWYLSYFHPDAARSIPSAGAQRHLDVHGENIGNVVQYMEREHKERFKTILDRIAAKIPGVHSIRTTVTEDKRVLLQFNDGAFNDPFYAGQMSDGTLKIFAYLLLMEDPEPPPFICIEEPENGLYHRLLDSLARELRSHATGKKNAPQIFVTTHQPYFVDALSAKEVWILEKGENGFSTICRASDIELVRNLVEEGLPLGGLWYGDYLDTK
ncbi:AAA family ATPase [Xanthomonas axonopodis pv. vasculorum]|uniref:ATPase n=1 Tax=Xanthomonas axonopodis pv. vasculorum TaxID=325777 RepID=A0A098PWM0_9XANT|nr:AAA family ATPase [Xanthomonas axonopodis]KGE51141.1 ATPase [Xanthomonas axonopodis pv. vasculorum]PPV10019.1 ATPase [Xanthomonas axonopodis pv. vasculorum]QKD85694.1 AAA family ATPase [Xanthomonas axonopodis pv. vasculorum]